MRRDKIIIAILGVSLTIIIGLTVFKTVFDKKESLIISQEVFQGFLGKKELESKLNNLKASHQNTLNALQDAIIKKRTAKKVDKGLVQKMQQHFLEQQHQFSKDEEEKTVLYTEQIWKQINQYTTEYGKEEGYAFIFGANGSGVLMYADDTKNITKEVIVFINRRYEGN